MPLDEFYFNKFDVERICIDKVFFVVYDEQYSIQEHDFDKDLRDRFIHNVKMSQFRKGRQQQVIRKENNYSSWELRLSGARTMYFHVNIIHFIQETYDIKPSHVIYDSNFLPIDNKLTVVDHVAFLRRFIAEAMEFYRYFVSKHWGEDLGKVRYKIVEIEIPFEVYPCSVQDIADNLHSKGLSFRKYNAQSGTIYLQDVKTDNMVKYANQKYDKIIKIDDYDLELPDKRDILYMNKINSGRNEHKIQIKIYQKTFGLCRIEFTMFSLDARLIFDYSRGDMEIAEDLINFIHHGLKENNILPERYDKDRSLDEIVRFLSIAFKESEDVIFLLRDAEIFETSHANRHLRERLTKKGLLIAKYDNDNIRQKGVYLVNPVIKDFLNIYKPKGNEHFLKAGLYADLN